MDEKLYETVNASSYDKIAEKWHSFRKNCKINLCISEFADIYWTSAAVQVIPSPNIFLSAVSG